MNWLNTGLQQHVLVHSRGNNQTIALTSANSDSKLSTVGSFCPQYSNGKLLVIHWYIVCHLVVINMARVEHFIGCNHLLFLF